MNIVSQLNPSLMKTILVVDDEPDLLEIMAFDFEHRGYEVLTAQNGRDAFKTATSRHVDLIITDMRMPNGDGLELMRKVHALAAPIPVICLSGYIDSSIEEIVRLGAFTVFEKPFDRTKLHLAVAQCLSQIKS